MRGRTGLPSCIPIRSHFFHCTNGNMSNQIFFGRPPANCSDAGRPVVRHKLSPRPRIHPVLENHSWRKRMPAKSCEPDPLKLQDRCRREGGDPDVVAMIPKVFSKGVDLKALTRLRTAEEVASRTFGKGPGPVYLVFLEVLPDQGGRYGQPRYGCRLCSSLGEGYSWKNQRDVLRHLRRQHFGVGDRCDTW